MKYAISDLPRARDPNSGTRMDMWVVWAFEDGEGIYQMAYCSKREYAEEIVAVLTREEGIMSTEHNVEERIMSSRDIMESRSQPVKSGYERTARVLVSNWFYSGQSGSGQGLELLIAAITGALEEAARGGK